MTQVVTRPELRPDRNRHEVVVLAALEGCVNGDKGRTPLADVLGIVELKPILLDDITALDAGVAHIHCRPCTGTAGRVVLVGSLEVSQPSIILTQLRTQCLAGFPTQRVAILRFHRNADNSDVRLTRNDTRHQIVEVPRGSYDDDLRSSRQTGLDGAEPCRPQLLTEGRGVRFHAVLDRVVYDDKVAGVTGDT